MGMQRECIPQARGIEMTFMYLFYCSLFLVGQMWGRRSLHAGFKVGLDRTASEKNKIEQSQLKVYMYTLVLELFNHVLILWASQETSKFRNVFLATLTQNTITFTTLEGFSLFWTALMQQLLLNWSCRCDIWKAPGGLPGHCPAFRLPSHWLLLFSDLQKFTLSRSSSQLIQFTLRSGLEGWVWRWDNCQVGFSKVTVRSIDTGHIR